MGQKKKEKITRDCLRAMKIGDTVVVECKDGYDWKSHATLTPLAKQDCPLWLQYD